MLTPRKMADRKVFLSSARQDHGRKTVRDQGVGGFSPS
jgi:hypothetical protein